MKIALLRTWEATDDLQYCSIANVGNEGLNGDKNLVLYCSNAQTRILLYRTIYLMNKEI